MEKRTHGGTKTTVHFENGELFKAGRVLWLWKIGIGDDLVIGGLDTVPVTGEWGVRWGWEWGWR